ncbi:hypothetical protein OBBRIDRAFT_824048 [Obba rivulosa]|uniref:Uncharacterized protein n=1 Tax=Obba rivulosa TaxID=1052685 RepID=A0A8E2DPR9_9APHY|nr:hypothetical protein OBBRIDRAFT_824048 [Obba rivulosa]
MLLGIATRFRISDRVELCAGWWSGHKLLLVLCFFRRKTLFYMVYKPLDSGASASGLISTLLPAAVPVMSSSTFYPRSIFQKDVPRETSDTGSLLISVPQHKPLRPGDMPNVFVNHRPGDENLLVTSLRDIQDLFFSKPGVLDQRMLPRFNSICLQPDQAAVDYLVGWISAKYWRANSNFQDPRESPRAMTSALVLSGIHFDELSLEDVSRFASWTRMAVVASPVRQGIQLSLIECKFQTIDGLLELLRMASVFHTLVVVFVRSTETPKRLYHHANSVVVPVLSMTFTRSEDIQLYDCLRHAAGNSLTGLDLHIVSHFGHHDQKTLERFISDSRLLSITLALRSNFRTLERQPANGYQLIMQTIYLLRRVNESQSARRCSNLNVRVYLPRNELFRHLLPGMGSLYSREVYLQKVLKVEYIQYALYDGPDKWYIPEKSHSGKHRPY